MEALRDQLLLLPRPMLHDLAKMYSRKCDPYAEFVKETRPRIKAENPGISFMNLGPLLRDAWFSLSSQEKERFENMATITMATTVAHAFLEDE